jgi:serine/threonine protein kinase
MHKLKSHAQVDPVPLDTLRDDVPKELVAITSRMMAKDPDERYLTPKEVADALESFLQTWQPAEVNKKVQEPSRGGNMSGSGGKNSRVGDAGWDGD